MAEKEKKQEDKDFEKEFTKLQKKHGLPNFEDLNKHFDIGELTDVKTPLRAVRKKIEERLEALAMLFNSILQPETKFSELQECRAFSDQEKDQVLELFKTIMINIRTANLISLDSSEEKEAEFLKTVYQEWTKKEGIQEKTMTIIAKLRDVWKEEIKPLEPMGYLG